MVNPIDRMTLIHTQGGLFIKTARQQFGALRNSKMTLVEFLSHKANELGFPFDAHPRNKVRAIINHGRWIVKCPFCPGGECVDPNEPVFFCLSCGNSDNAGHVMDVQFPDERGMIEAILLRRPRIENRNWNGEAPGILMQESLEHNVA